MSVGLTSDFLDFFKQFEAKERGVEKWTDIYTRLFNESKSVIDNQVNQAKADLQNQFNASELEIEKASKKNISSAYSNYLASQIQMRHATGLTSGYKNILSDKISSAYENAVKENELALNEGLKELGDKEFSELQALDAQKLQTYQQLQNDIQKQMKSDEEALTEQALRMSSIVNKDIFKYINDAGIGPNGEIISDLSPHLFIFDNEGKVLGWSDYAKDVFFNKDTLTWTPQGQEFMGYLLGSGFDAWASQNWTDAEYDSWMSGDRNRLNQSIFTDEDGNPLTLNPYAGNRDNNAQFYKNLDVESRARYYGDELKLNKDLSKQTFSEEEVKELFKGTEVDSDPKQTSRNEFATRNDNDLWALVMQDALKNPELKQDINVDVQNYSGHGQTANVKYYSIKQNTELKKLWNTIKTETTAILKREDDLRVGEVFDITGGYLAYWDGKDLRFARKSDINKK